MLKSRKRKKCPPGCVKKPIRKTSRKRRSAKKKASRKRRSVKRKVSRKRRSVKRKVSRKRRSVKRKASRKASRKRRSAKKKASRKRRSAKKNKFRVKGTRRGTRRGKRNILGTLAARKVWGQPFRREAAQQLSAARREAARKRIYRGGGILVDNAMNALMAAKEMGLIDEHFLRQFDANILLNPETGFFRIKTDGPFYNAHIWNSLEKEDEALNFLNKYIRREKLEHAARGRGGFRGFGLYRYRNPQQPVTKEKIQLRGDNKFEERTITPTICKYKTTSNYYVDTFGRCDDRGEKKDVISKRIYEEM